MTRMTSNLTLVDAGTGNLRSVQKALESLGARVQLTSDPEVVAAAGKVVLPGVGAFGDFMQGLRARGLEEALVTFFRHGNPLLGICVGMQALFESGEELGVHQGLGLLTGKVVHFPDLHPLKVPHTGWNQLTFCHPSPLSKGLNAASYAYFNHAYYCEAKEEDTTASTEYGIRFSSAIQHENLYGVQFHPEKSQRVGLKILENFLKLS